MDPADQSDVSRAAQLLRDGGVVAFPTETVYGLGANALNPEAVARIFEIKGRPRFDPLIVHLADPAALPSLVQSAPAAAMKLARQFWPGPLTLVLRKQPIVPDIVTAGLPNVAIRVPDHALAQQLIRLAGVPVAAPSANRFGRVSPTTAAHVFDEIGDRVDMVLDGGPCRTGVESTIISFVELDGSPLPQPALLRLGGVEIEAVEAVIGPVVRPQGPASPAAVAAPGMLRQHYSPRTRLIMLNQLEPRMHIGRVGYLAFQHPPYPVFDAVEVLSPTGSLAEAAARLFAALRRLDARNLDLIVAEPAPPHGLGLAINDRLLRASGEPEVDDPTGN